MPCREWSFRQDDSSSKFLHVGRELAERHAVDVPRRKARFTFSVPLFIRQAGDPVSQFGQHQLNFQSRLPFPALSGGAR